MDASGLVVNKAVDSTNRVVYLRAKTKSGLQAIQTLTFTVACGTETISINNAVMTSKLPKGTTLSVAYDSTAATDLKIITAADGFDLLGVFDGASSSSLCPVTSVQLFYDPGSGITSWTDTTKIKVDVSNQLNVNQKVEIAL